MLILEECFSCSIQGSCKGLQNAFNAGYRALAKACRISWQQDKGNWKVLQNAHHTFNRELMYVTNSRAELVKFRARRRLRHVDLRCAMSCARKNRLGSKSCRCTSSTHSHYVCAPRMLEQYINRPPLIWKFRKLS